MSQYFDDATTGETLWNPATRVAQLFFRMTEALVPVADRPCGVVDSQIDEYAVNVDAFDPVGDGRDLVQRAAAAARSMPTA